MVPGSGYGLGSRGGSGIRRDGRAADVGYAGRLGTGVVGDETGVAHGGRSGDRYLGKRTGRRCSKNPVTGSFLDCRGLSGRETRDVVSGNFGAVARSGPSRLSAVHEGSRTARIFGIADEPAYRPFHSCRIIPDDEGDGSRKDSRRLDETQVPRLSRRRVRNVGRADEDIIGVRRVRGDRR